MAKSSLYQQQIDSSTCAGIIIHKAGCFLNGQAMMCAWSMREVMLPSEVSLLCARRLEWHGRTLRRCGPNNQDPRKPSVRARAFREHRGANSWCVGYVDGIPTLRPKVKSKRSVLPMVFHTVSPLLVWFSHDLQIFAKI